MVYDKNGGEKIMKTAAVRNNLLSCRGIGKQLEASLTQQEKITKN